MKSISSLTIKKATSLIKYIIILFLLLNLSYVPWLILRALLCQVRCGDTFWNIGLYLKGSSHADNVGVKVSHNGALKWEKISREFLSWSRSTPIGRESFWARFLTPTLSGFEILNDVTLIIKNWLVLRNIFWNLLTVKCFLDN